MESKSLHTTIATSAGIDSATASALTAAFVEALREHCSSLRTVALPRLGTFAGVKHEEAVTVDPSTGRRMLTPPRIDIEFTPSQALKNAVKNG